LRLFSFGGYGLALAALALVVFGAYDSYPYHRFKFLSVEIEVEKSRAAIKIVTGLSASYMSSASIVLFAGYWGGRWVEGGRGGKGALRVAHGAQRPAAANHVASQFCTYRTL